MWNNINFNAVNINNNNDDGRWWTTQEKRLTNIGKLVYQCKILHKLYQWEQKVNNEKEEKTLRIYPISIQNKANKLTHKKHHTIYCKLKRHCVLTPCISVSVFPFGLHHPTLSRGRKRRRERKLNQSCHGNVLYHRQSVQLNVHFGPNIKASTFQLVQRITRTHNSCT